MALVVGRDALLRTLSVRFAVAVGVEFQCPPVLPFREAARLLCVLSPHRCFPLELLGFNPCLTCPGVGHCGVRRLLLCLKSGLVAFLA